MLLTDLSLFRLMGLFRGGRGVTILEKGRDFGPGRVEQYCKFYSALVGLLTLIASLTPCSVINADCSKERSPVQEVFRLVLKEPYCNDLVR